MSESGSIFRYAALRCLKIKAFCLKLATSQQALIFQLLRFGIVGVFAAAIHFLIVVTLVQTFSYEPLIANIFAFFISFQASYFGHRRFTFTGTTALHVFAFPKLLMVQIFNFIANESLFYFFLSFHLPYQVALILVLSILPLFTFVISKLWVFK
jgi:putative flippase GtrA